MEGSTRTTGTPSSRVDDAAALLTELDAVVWAAQPPDQLLDAAVALERLRSRVSAILAQVAVEIDASDAQQQLEWASPRDYLTSLTGGRRGSGARLLRTAHALTRDQERTWLALHRGDISPDQAEVIVAAISKLPVAAAVRDKAESVLLAEAATKDASELKVLGRHLLEVIDPDGQDARDEKALDRQERAAHLQRHLTVTEDGIGGVRLRGRGTVEDAAVIKAALAALAAPVTSGRSGTESTNSSGWCDNGRDPRDHGARTWDALVGACQRLLDTDVLPEAHGAKPRIMVTLDYENLRTGTGAALLETGERISAAAVRRLACDADLVPAVLGSRAEVLDVGRTRRLVTAALWKALVLRDRHCAFPGCRRPPVACDAHHLVSWLDGGATSLENLVLLCRAHHTAIHRSGWKIRMHGLEGRPEFLPPPGRQRRDDQGGGTAPPGRPDDGGCATGRHGRSSVHLGARGRTFKWCYAAEQDGQPWSTAGPPLGHGWA